MLQRVFLGLFVVVCGASLHGAATRPRLGSGAGAAPNLLAQAWGEVWDELRSAGSGVCIEMVPVAEMGRCFICKKDWAASTDLVFKIQRGSCCGHFNHERCITEHALLMTSGCDDSPWQICPCELAHGDEGGLLAQRNAVRHGSDTDEQWDCVTTE